MLLINIVAWILFVFLAFYMMLQIIITLSSSKGKIKDIEKRNYNPKFQQNITVIVYSHNNASHIINLVDSLKKQNYDNDKYSINIILDNSTDESSKLLEILGGTRLWRICTDVKPIGRNKAVAWLLERILTNENTNVFVVIDADCVVKPDFMSKVNTLTMENQVVIGDVQALNKQNNFITDFVIYKNNFRNRVTKHGRFYANLHNLLEGSVWAIRQDVLEKTNFIVIDNGFEEYEYSVKLSKLNIPIATSTELFIQKTLDETVKTAAIEEYKRRYKAFITLKNNLKVFFSFNNSFKTKELMLSLIYPTGAAVLIINVFLILLKCKFYETQFAQIIKVKYLLWMLGLNLFIKLFQLLASGSSFNDCKNSVLSLVLSPYLHVVSIFEGFKANFTFKLSFPKKLLYNRETNKQIISTIISDSKKDLHCKLAIKQNTYNTQAIFIFKEKKLYSSKYPRIFEALKELIEKLNSHGFKMKICINCKYFKVDNQVLAKFNGEQGYCNYDCIHKKSKAKEYCYIWNTCENLEASKSKLDKKDEQDSTKDIAPKE